MGFAKTLFCAALVSLIMVSYASAAEFTLEYRADNRWVHQNDKAPLNKLSNYAKKNKVATFDVILPNEGRESIYIERLLILSKILKSRLDDEVVVFRQKVGETSENTIKVIPNPAQ